MKEIVIKEATLSDISLLQTICKQTFHETYSKKNTEEDMKKHQNEKFSTENLIAELKNKNSKIYFAILDNDVTGYLKLNFGEAQTELQDSNALEIERIYVLQEFQGKNVGQMFYQTAIQVAKQINANYIWLGVWEENPRAICFYKKNGFIEFDKHIFILGDDKQTDIMMKLKLKDYL